MKYQRKRKSTSRKYKKKSTVSLKNQLMRMVESKFSNFENNAFPLGHNQYYVLSPTQNVQVGTTGSTRIGDQIYLQNLQVNGFITSSAAANAAQRYRIMVYWSKSAATATAISNVGAGLDVFQPTTYTALTNGIVNPKAISLISDMIIDVNCSVSTAKEIKSFAFNVPLKQNFQYNVPGSTLGKTKNLYIAIAPFIQDGITGPPTSCGFIALSYALKFKDP